MQRTKAEVHDSVGFVERLLVQKMSDSSSESYTALLNVYCPKCSFEGLEALLLLLVSLLLLAMLPLAWRAQSKSSMRTISRTPVLLLPRSRKSHGALQMLRVAA